MENRVESTASGPEQLIAAINQWRRPRILVFGDVILDHYSWGQVQRISPEAPIPVLRYEREEYRLGGAAAVAGLLAGLGATVACIGVTGHDAHAALLRERFQQSRIDWQGVDTDDGRPTTTKHRFLSSRHGHTQLLRVDYEVDTPISPAVENRLYDAWLSALRHCDAVIISDYAKGVCQPTALQRLISTATAAGVPVLVDPARRSDFRAYAEATAIVPNRYETELVTGITIAQREDVLRLGGEVCQRWEVPTAVIKLDQEGIVLLRSGEPARHFPIKTRTVFDVTGAGDTVISVLAMCLAERQSWDVACELANFAGGIQVQRVGVASLSREDVLSAVGVAWNGNSRRGKILNLAEAAQLSHEAQARGQRVVFTNGCFAALHAGHVAYLQEARQLGDLLIVACNSAASIRRLKGDRPIIPDGERLQLLAALSCVDGVLLFEEDTPHHLLRAIHPDLLVKGGTTDVIVGREIVESYGGRVMRLSAIAGASTTQLLADHRGSGKAVVNGLSQQCVEQP